jgi:hypothetical protein
MYTSCHSSSAALASRRVRARTISGLMRHERLAITEIYIAYLPQD